MLRRGTLAIAAGFLALAALHAVTRELVPGGVHDFGRSVHLPPPGFLGFMAIYAFLGTIAVAAFAVAIQDSMLDRGRRAKLVDLWLAGDDRRWLLYGSFFAFALPALIRTYFLDSLPLTDDEGAYRFMAQVLAGGRLWADSAPVPLAFDNRFLINDGRMYAQYFLGWPALLVPGVLLGISGFVNSLISALTLPPIYFLLRRELGVGWARVGVVLYLSSPMLLLLAATELSHTSCLCALAWFSWWIVRGRDDDAGATYHAAAAVAFCVAFWVRPLSALGIGVPWLVVWAVRELRPRRWRRVLAFALPAAALAGLFLAVNWAQNGSITTVAYDRYLEYSRSNDFRFSIWGGEPRPEEHEMAWLGSERSLAMNAGGLLRLNTALFGWVTSFLFIAFAGRGLLSRLMAWSIATFVLSHVAVGNIGIDAFAPMHFIELAWPVLILTVLGLARMTARLRDFPQGRHQPLPLAVAASLVLVAWLGYVPTRAEGLDRMLQNIAQPYDAAAALDVDRAVIFVNDTWVPYCLYPPTRGWVFGRPNNRPDLSDDILWANHLTVEINAGVAAGLGRPGFLLAWTPECRPLLVPLEDLGPGTVRSADVSGLDEVIVPPPSEW
ncbi:MAG: hypothetical protein AAGM22_18060 [Acidobacteriota bacterium]